MQWGSAMIALKKERFYEILAIINGSIALIIICYYVSPVRYVITLWIIAAIHGLIMRQVDKYKGVN